MWLIIQQQQHVGPVACIRVNLDIGVQVMLHAGNSLGANIEYQISGVGVPRGDAAESGVGDMKGNILIKPACINEKAVQEIMIDLPSLDTPVHRKIELPDRAPFLVISVQKVLPIGVPNSLGSNRLRLEAYYLVIHLSIYWLAVVRTGP